MIVTYYICNVCGKEHEDKEDAVYCHPDIVEKKYSVSSYKNNAGEVIEFKSKEIT